MATTSALSRRKKQATYGKASRSVNTWNSGNLDALDEDELSIVEPALSRPSGVTKSYSIQKRETKPNSPRSKPAKKREIKEDVWDVPSSESSEDEISPARRQPAPRFGGKGKSDKSEEVAKLAPWEKAKAGVLSPAQRTHPRQPKPNVPALSEETEVIHDGDRDMSVPASPSNIGNEQRAKIASPVQPSPKSSSAAARLQARRLQSGHSIATAASKPNPTSKRAAQASGQTGVGPRKRLRSNKSNDDDVLMDDASTPSCEGLGASTAEDVPSKGTSDDPRTGRDITTTAAATTKPIQAGSTQGARRGKITAYSSPRKMESAPARLSEMLPADIDSTDDTQSPSLTNSRPSTPQKSGDSGSPSSPQTVFKTGASTRQNQLLGRLMSDESAVPSPGALPMQALNINSARRAPAGHSARKLPKSSSDVGRPRTKLVDRLKASALSSDDESSEDDSTVASDVDMNDAGDREAATSDHTQSQGQSQSQGQGAAGNNRPKFTYAAAQVTWLKEDSLEDELMLDTPTQCQQRPVVPTRNNFEDIKSASQKSTFEMEDSDDEGAAGRLRTIHELRAGGVNRRFMDDISGLLEDVANHNHTARSRRRSALIDLATKLADKTFAAKFFRQGFEQQLFSEYSAPPDDIADFALAVTIVVILTGDPPEHSAQSLKEGGGLSMLVRMLDSRVDPRKLAKERRNNMSKGAQSDFSRFVSHVTEQQSVWGETTPTLVTPRTIALKALDSLVSKLRRLGDRSEILSSREIEEVISSPAEFDLARGGEVPVDVTLSISVLESLSTTTVSLSWPVEVTESLRMMLSSPIAPFDTAHHLRFLTLRLCLNLTNDNPKNCKAFAKADTVVALLKSMVDGFECLFNDQEESKRTISLDLLVLSMGIMINLTEQKSNACGQAATEDAAPLLAALVATFLRGQQRTLEAESVEDGVANVAFGYLAVVLANLCRNREARQTIASGLPGKRLDALVEAVHEFVVHHQKVDALNFEGEEGSAVWSAFTEKLKGVLSRLSAEAEADEIDRR